MAPVHHEGEEDVARDAAWQAIAPLGRIAADHMHPGDTLPYWRRCVVSRLVNPGMRNGPPHRLLRPVMHEALALKDGAPGLAGSVRQDPSCGRWW
jgi:hypothetical protein